MIIFGVITAISCLTFTDCENKDKTVRQQADELAMWLTEKMTRAQLEECRFKLSMSQHSTKNISLRLTWQGGAEDGQTETYKTSKVRIFPVTGGLSISRIFDGEWSSLSPALTLDVKPQPPGNAKTLYVIVSGAGCVSVRERAN